MCWQPRGSQSPRSRRWCWRRQFRSEPGGSYLTSAWDSPPSPCPSLPPALQARAQAVGRSRWEGTPKGGGTPSRAFALTCGGACPPGGARGHMSALRGPCFPSPVLTPDPGMPLPHATLNIQPVIPKSRADPLRGEPGAPRLDGETDGERKLSPQPHPQPLLRGPAVGAGPLGSREQVADCALRVWLHRVQCSEGSSWEQGGGHPGSESCPDAEDTAQELSRTRRPDGMGQPGGGGAPTSQRGAASCSPCSPVAGSDPGRRACAGTPRGCMVPTHASASGVHGTGNSSGHQD